MIKRWMSQFLRNKIFDDIKDKRSKEASGRTIQVAGSCLSLFHGM